MYLRWQRISYSIFCTLACKLSSFPIETFISCISRNQGPCFLSFIVTPTCYTTLRTWNRKCAHVTHCVKLWQPQPTAYKLTRDPPYAYKPSLPPVAGLEMTKPQTECKRNTTYSQQSTAVGTWNSVITKELNFFNQNLIIIVLYYIIIL
jgi:hypothetical protein